ncbi:MAG: Gfo/Idh/MocA family oxidoreductase [Bryobacteraceae bacterium]|nr:Gfo/Idh/MocA family oxidoreductase [Bryobacteraceae bacterium]
MTRGILFLAAGSLVASAQIKIGIIGTDTSHVPAFTRSFNDPKSPDYVPGARVVAAFKAGSPDVESSRTRVDGFAKEISEKWGVEIVPDIATLLSKVDAVLIESVDGRTHLPQARAVIAAGKPFFVDKPLASTLADAREIAKLAAAAKVPWFSSSSLRYSEWVVALKAGGDIAGALAWSPGSFEEHHKVDLTWYGIHGVETLYALMGRGCGEVTRVATPDMDEISCRWNDGRIGSVRVIRPKTTYGAVVFRKNGSVSTSPADAKVNYTALVREIAKFFQTGKSPVPPAETLEIMEFMDAAQRSKDSGGKPIRIR